MNQKGTIITLAWPETPVYKEGKWYDSIMNFLGFLKNDYYKAGHSAMVLINHSSNEIDYFDFGRYQTPHKRGRVRDKFTDSSLSIITKPIIQNEKISNIEEILKELNTIKETNGKGKLLASEKKINSFQKGYDKAKLLQEKGTIKYGPLTIDGTNCSRFVAKIAKTSGVGITRYLLLKIPYTFTPTPFSNIKIINDFGYYYELNNGEVIKKKNRLFYFKK